MHRIFGTFGSIIGSAALFTLGFVAVYGHDFVLANIVAVAMALGLIVGVFLALADKLTDRRPLQTIATAMFVGAVTVALSILGMETVAYGNFAINATIVGIGAVFCGMNGFFYWLSARAYTNLRSRGNASKCGCN